MLPKRKPARRCLNLALLFTLLRKGEEPTDKLDTLIRLDDDESAYSRIRCPLCKWQPNANSRWNCGGGGPPEYYQGCGTGWNTFDTGGVCPGCDHQWRWTACLSCSNYSLHEAWYTDEED
ncbi:MAG: hypothetical protein ACRD82_10215 [Blastocatellia bacterium]